MPKYIVDLCRTAYQVRQVEVEAESIDKAESAALAMAGDVEFSGMEERNSYTNLG